MSTILYYTPGVCSLAVHALLIDTGAAFEARKASDFPQEFAEASPLGAVPVLVQDGKALREGAAILTHLCETHRSHLLPAGGWDKAIALQWLAFANSTLHPRYSVLFGFMRSLGADARSNPLYAQAEQRVQQGWDVVDSALQHGEYVCGQSISIADILLAVIANWTPRVSDKIVFSDRLRAYVARVQAYPALAEAMQREGGSWAV